MRERNVFVYVYYMSVESPAVNNSTSESDEDLVQRVQSGDSEAFGKLVDRFEQKLLRYGRKFLAEREDIVDIVQDVFIRAYQNIQSFDVSQRFSPWIYRIAHNAFVNKLRNNRYQPFRIDFDTFVAHPVYENVELSERERHEMKELIDLGMQMLPQKYREVLVLHYFEELPYSDIADILKIPMGTVSIRLKRAKDALKRQVQDKL